MTSSQRCIGLLGGTFDPVHNGHLRLALELKQRLGFHETRLLPCHLPPHRQAPECSSENRLAMVELALVECPELTVDSRELQRERPSYTLETLEELRAELGPEVSLCWCVGMDSLASLDTWHRWREILDFAHLVVARRPGWQPPAAGELGEWLRDNLAANTEISCRQSAGAVILVDSPILEISATAIRAAIAAGKSAQFLLPDAVWRYIRDNRVYLPK